MECKGCGAQIDIRNAVNGVVECEYCHRIETLAKTTNDDAKHFLKMGEHDLDSCKFDEAYTAYKKASEYDGREPQAYFGMALAEFNIQYIRDVREEKDPVTKELKKVYKLQPICHEINEKKFIDNKNYKAAMLCASNEQRSEYQRRANEIDYIKQEFNELKKQGIDYDCFICVKVTDEQKNRTKDYTIADDMYTYLKDKGCNPFFSEREIKNRTGADYEAMILYALYTSECMIVVCGNEEYLQTPWVKNEYTRFISLINDEQKERDAITIAFDGKPIEKLPGRNGKLQGIDMKGFGASERVLDFVQTHTPEAQERRKQANERKQREEERIKQQLEELKAQQDAAREELERKLASVQSGGTAAQPTGGATVYSLLVRAKQFLNDGDFNNARQYCNRILDIEPENSDAWFLLLLIENRVMPTDKYLSIVDGLHAADDVDKLLNSQQYKNTKKYAGSDSRLIAVEKALTEKRAQLIERARIERERREKEEMEIRERNELAERRSRVQSQFDDAKRSLDSARYTIFDYEKETECGKEEYINSRVEQEKYEWVNGKRGAVVSLIGFVILVCAAIILSMSVTDSEMVGAMILSFVMIGIGFLANLIGLYVMLKDGDFGGCFVLLWYFPIVPIWGPICAMRTFYKARVWKKKRKIDLANEYEHKIAKIQQLRLKIPQMEKEVDDISIQLNKMQ